MLFHSYIRSWDIILLCTCDIAPIVQGLECSHRISTIKQVSGASYTDKPAHTVFISLPLVSTVPSINPAMSHPSARRNRVILSPRQHNAIIPFSAFHLPCSSIKQSIRSPRQHRWVNRECSGPVRSAQLQGSPPGADGHIPLRGGGFAMFIFDP